MEECPICGEMTLVEMQEDKMWTCPYKKETVLVRGLRFSQCFSCETMTADSKQLTYNKYIPRLTLEDYATGGISS